MPTQLYIYSSQTSPALHSEGRQGLEDDLKQLLEGNGDVTGGGSALNSNSWNIDLELYDGVPPEPWIDRVRLFLREWGVPPDTYLEVFLDDWVKGPPSRTVHVF